MVEINKNTKVAVLYDSDLLPHFTVCELSAKCGVNFLRILDFKLDSTGYQNLVATCYLNEPWLLQDFNGTKGYASKADKCAKACPSARYVSLVLFTHHEDADLVALKDYLRLVSCVDGKHSIHITDDIVDTTRVWRTVNNEYAEHYLNNIQLLDKPEIWQTLQTAFSTNTEEFAITGSLLMSLLGTYKFKDIDVVATSELATTEAFSRHAHNNQAGYDAFYNVESFDEMFTTDERENNMFFFINWNFLTPERVIEFKKRRNEPKDHRHIEELREIIDNRQQNLFF